jgi:hypothetical protein
MYVRQMITKNVLLIFETAKIFKVSELLFENASLKKRVLLAPSP